MDASVQFPHSNVKRLKNFGRSSSLFPNPLLCSFSARWNNRDIWLMLSPRDGFILITIQKLVFLMGPGIHFYLERSFRSVCRGWKITSSETKIRDDVSTGKNQGGKLRRRRGKTESGCERGQRLAGKNNQRRKWSEDGFFKLLFHSLFSETPFCFGSLPAELLFLVDDVWCFQSSKSGLIRSDTAALCLQLPTPTVISFHRSLSCCVSHCY